jgi:hypothetical protein
MAYKLITTTSVTSGTAANITFSSIPTTYTDLKILLTARGNNAGTNVDLTTEFNNDPSSNSLYTQRYMFGRGGTAPSAGTQSYGQSAIMPGGTWAANYFSNTYIYIPNYNSSSTHKMFWALDASTQDSSSQFTWYSVNKWASNNAITSIKLFPLTGSFVTGTTASIYGI